MSDYLPIVQELILNNPNMSVETCFYIYEFAVNPDDALNQPSSSTIQNSLQQNFLLNAPFKFDVGSRILVTTQLLNETQREEREPITVQINQQLETVRFQLIYSIRITNLLIYELLVDNGNDDEISTE